MVKPGKGASTYFSTCPIHLKRMTMASTTRHSYRRGNGQSRNNKPPPVSREFKMAFMKKSVALTKPKTQDRPNLPHTLGEEREGMVWDGQSWVPKELWNKKEN
jgi:hypothetical protein